LQGLAIEVFGLKATLMPEARRKTWGPFQ